MAGVLDKLEQVRALDPAAEPKLLEELHHTPPNTWPLVAEQYRATLAYHQQLMAKEQTPSQSGEYTSDALLGSPITGQPQSVGLAISTQPSSKADLGNERLSSRIGALGDPRGMGTESSRVLAQTTPDAAANVAGTGAGEKVPAKFVGDVAMQPLDRGKSAAADQAIYHAGADDMHPVSQALAKSEPGGPVNAASSPNKEISTAKVADTSEANDDWQRLVRKAADDLAKRVSASPSTTAEIHQHVSLRMLWLLSGDTEKALEPIPHISPAEQDYWSSQLFALATYLDHHSQPDDKRRASASVIHLDEAVAHLREMGSLSLRNLSFCKNVYGYGAFEPYEADMFAPGQQVSLYVEVENYHSTANEKGYSTLLGATYELLDDKGRRVSGGEFPDVDDTCRSRRRDFHIQLGLSMPENLTPGRYRLELVVKDRQSDKLGHATAPFEIRSGRK